MKCIPITCAGRFVTAAILVIDIELVLVAKMASSGACSSISRNILSLRSTFSVAASTTRSASDTADTKSVLVVILANAAILSSSEIFSFATILSRFLPIVAIALSNAASDISQSTTV